MINKFFKGLFLTVLLMSSQHLVALWGIPKTGWIGWGDAPKIVLSEVSDEQIIEAVETEVSTTMTNQIVTKELTPPKPLTQEAQERLLQWQKQGIALYKAAPNILKLSLGSALTLYGIISAIEHVDRYSKQRKKQQLRFVACLWFSAASTCLGCKIMVDGMKA